MKPILLLTLLASLAFAGAQVADSDKQPEKQWKTATTTPTTTISTSTSNSRDYYYARTRSDPNHLRIAEDFKNAYTAEAKFESIINNTKYEYYKSSISAQLGQDELTFEIFDKIFRHRLSPFYIHHYDSEEDKRRSFDASKVSQEACARDLLYLVDKLPISNGPQKQEEPLTPELAAFFDSYARQESGLLMGNTFWVGAYDQCVNRRIFDLIDPQAADSAGRQQSQKTSAISSETPTGERRQHQQAVSFGGRYCVASLKAPIWDQLIAKRRAQSQHYFRSKHQEEDYPKLFRIQVGICLPDSCDSTSYERHLEEIKLLTTGQLEQRFGKYDLIDLYCLPDEASPLRQWSGSALNFLIFLGLWLTLVLLATLADVFEFVASDSAMTKSTSKEGTAAAAAAAAVAPRRTSTICKLVCWFSLRANYRKLMHVNEQEEEKANVESKAAKKDYSPANDTRKADPVGYETKSAAAQAEAPLTQPLKVDLKFLNAFKVLIMFWIVNGHIMLLMIQTAKNILYSDALLNGLMHFLIGATFGVDLFFTMTGFITSYLIFNSGHAFKMRPTTWIYLSFHRYWRLAPLYLLTFWFSRSVIQLLGSGPLWDYGTSAITFRGLCNTQSWWYPLTLTSNLHGLFEESMITSWYISNDMQFWLVSPIFIYLLAKSPLNGWLLSLATIIASSKLRYDSIWQSKSARYDELLQPRADIFMRVSHDLPALYTHPHYRIPAYLIGLLAGHYVYMLQQGKWKSPLTFDLEKRRSGQGQRQKDCDAKLVPEAGLEISNQSMTTTLTKNDDNQKMIEKENEGIILTAQNEKPLQSTDNKLNQNTTATTTTTTREQQGNRLRNLLAYTGLTFVILISFASYLMSRYFPSTLLVHQRNLASLFYSVDHLIMSLAASSVIISMCFGKWRSLVNFLSHPNWTRLSKINYALLLLQCESIYFQIFRYEQVPLAGTRELVNILFNLLVTLYPLAAVVTLVFEYPLANLEKLLLGSRR